MTGQLYLIITEDDQILQRGLTMFEAENALCRHINLGAENAFIGEDDQDWIYCDNRMPVIDYSKAEYARYVTCLVSNAVGNVMSANYVSNGFAVTERGRRPRWEQFGRILDGIIAWKLIPESAKGLKK